MKVPLLGSALCLLTVLTALAEEPGTLRQGPMTQKQLETLLRSLAPGAEGVPGALSFEFRGVKIECISDVVHDRMRLVTVIAPVSELTAEQVGRILEANFHTALDARYATSQGYLYAAFIHPLSPLTDGEVRSAVAQVANLAREFGGTYSSGGLVYGGDAPPI